MTITIGEPVATPTSSAALSLSIWLYSDNERDLIGCVWFEAIARLLALRELDHHDGSDKREAIGAAISACFVIVAKCTAKGTSSPVPGIAWQHRGPDCSLADLNAALNRLSENAGRLASICRAVILSNERAVVAGATQQAVIMASSCIHNGQHGADLRAIAAFHRLSLRECFEAFAATRSSKLAKNAKRYAK